MASLINELVEKIFEQTFRCWAPPMYLDAAQHHPIGIHPNPTVMTGVDGVVLTIANSNEKNIIESMFGHTTYTGNPDVDKRRSSEPISVTITIAHMAEVLHIGGTFTLVEPCDAPIITDILDEYLAVTHDMKRYSPHYSGPPTEDLDKLYSLNVAILPLSGRVSKLGLGEGLWSEIEAMFTNTGVYVVGGDNDHFMSATEPSMATTKRTRPNPYKL